MSGVTGRSRIYDSQLVSKSFINAAMPPAAGMIQDQGYPASVKLDHPVTMVTYYVCVREGT